MEVEFFEAVVMLKIELAFLKAVVNFNYPALYKEFETTFANSVKESKEKNKPKVL